MKPGIKTTEFWLNLIVSLLGVLVATGVITPADQSALADAAAKLAGAVMACISAAGYAVSRGRAKNDARRE